MHHASNSAPAAIPHVSIFHRLTRLGLAVAQRLWPALAVGAAQRLFGTPSSPRRRRRRAWPAHWRFERLPFERAGITIYRHANAATGPVALLVHGWGGHAGQMLPLAEALAARGLQPVIAEMPAHGRSGGGYSNLPQFSRAIEYLCARLQAEGQAVQAVVAHSLGATAAARACARGLTAHRLVLLAPPASPKAYTRWFARNFGLSERTRAAMQTRIEACEGVLMEQFEPQAVGPHIHVPVLVVHDRADRINRFADGQAFARAIANARLHATEGLDHLGVLKDAAVLALVAEHAGASTMEVRTA